MIDPASATDWLTASLSGGLLAGLGVMLTRTLREDATPVASPIGDFDVVPLAWQTAAPGDHVGRTLVSAGARPPG